jgi:hypothetical protein
MNATEYDRKMKHLRDLEQLGQTQTPIYKALKVAMARAKRDENKETKS